MSPPPHPLVVAHRGSSIARPEHTRAAYELALAEGAEALECDVRLTADGELVLLHDRTLERTGLGDGVVSTMTLAELRAVDWGAWRYAVPAPDGAHPTIDGPRVDGDGDLLTLRELVELARGASYPVGLAVETKHPTRAGGRVERAVADVLRDAGMTGPARPGAPWARVMSFSHLALLRLRTLLPDLPTVLLVGLGQSGPFRTGALLGGASTLGLDVAALRAHPDTVAAQHEAGHEVWVWTVDDDADIARCLNLGVDAIISNNPARCLSARLDVAPVCG
ncbi:glycerophosphoryl diester phosphodiesterase [Lapillicoccus jejuensis]|uniref:Glycerophosphoryl diester phosphodiesterase n=1 Tax=Lapillicoccus jejuensis TaxID=402171 RepID=A0A542DYP4_9MICO|nr:glycerophosphoryl diester phosphodiesterase [Lapillicoccus jejuensis]